MSNQRRLRPDFLERLGVGWCRMMHDSAMWPIGGHYRCRACGRSFPVAWERGRAAEPVQIWIRPEQRVTRRAA